MGERGTRKEKEERKEREKELCYWHTKAPCLGELSQKVLPWRIHHYRSPSNFEPLSPVAGKAPWGSSRGFCWDQRWSHSRESKRKGLTKPGRLTTWLIFSVDRRRTDTPGSSRTQWRAAVPMEQGSIQNEQLGM